jgi:hypothetical protein
MSKHNKNKLYLEIAKIVQSGGKIIFLKKKSAKNSKEINDRIKYLIYNIKQLDNLINFIKSVHNGKLPSDLEKIFDSENNDTDDETNDETNNDTGYETDNEFDGTKDNEFINDIGDDNSNNIKKDEQNSSYLICGKCGKKYSIEDIDNFFEHLEKEFNIKKKEEVLVQFSHEGDNEDDYFSDLDEEDKSKPKILIKILPINNESGSRNINLMYKQKYDKYKTKYLKLKKILN